MRIVEECGCGARIEFDKRTRQTYAEQDRADQQFLTQFRNEHSCSLRAPKNVECQFCEGGEAWWTAIQANDCPACGGAGTTPENVEEPMTPCDACDGEGHPSLTNRAVDSPCPTCNGSGVKRNLNQRWKEPCPNCTPENVEEQT